MVVAEVVFAAVTARVIVVAKEEVVVLYDHKEIQYLSRRLSQQQQKFVTATTKN